MPLSDTLADGNHAQISASGNSLSNPLNDALPFYDHTFPEVIVLALLPPEVRNKER